MDKEMGELLETSNCDACGDEHFKHELRTVKVSGFGHPLAVCKGCLSKTTSESYKDAAEILADIVKIAVRSADAEARLEAIKKLLEG
jgi:uncharacterized CHY-type Zn-finger protein